MLARCSLVVQMPANHGVKRNSPHVALLQGACRQTRPEAKMYGKRLKIRILKPREAPGCLPEGPGPTRGEPCGAQTLCYAMLCLLIQMPANHGVKRNSPHDALLQGACRQARPEAKMYGKRLKKLHILRPREAPGGLQEGPGRTPGGPREAPRSIPRLHMSTKGLQEFRCFRFPHVSPTKNANSEARRCSVSNSFTFSRGKCKKPNRWQPRNIAKPE